MEKIPGETPNLNHTESQTETKVNCEKSKCRYFGTHGFPSLKLEASSRFDIEEFILEWKLNIFSYGNLAKTEIVESPIFLGGERGKHSWKLKWKPDRERWGRFGVDVILVAIGEGCVTTRGKIKATGIISFKEPEPGSPGQFGREQNELTFFGVEAGGKLSVLNSFITYEQLYNESGEKTRYIVDNVLTVRCRILVNLGIHQSKILETILLKKIVGEKPADIYARNSGERNEEDKPPKAPFKDDNLHSLVHVMRTVLDSADFSDVQLVTKTKTFPVHKVILAARSPVFAAMFRTQMLEAKENSVEIADFEEAAVEAMLDFIYTSYVCKTEPSQESSMDLFRIADKYEIMELKAECEKRIASTLKIENAAQVLNLAILYNVPFLKEAAVEFIHGHKMEVAETDGFKKLVDSSPSLLLELYLAV